MSGMYRGQGDVGEEVPSEVGDVGYQALDAGDERVAGSERVSAGPAKAAFRKDVQGKVLKGRGTVMVDPRKYRYDVVRGRGQALGFTATKDDRMSVAEAERTLHEIHVMCGVDREKESILHAFDNALWFCHAVNGASVLNPGRSTFSVPEVTQEFDYAHIRDKLQGSLRRFFRAYADDVIVVVKQVLQEYDPYDPVKMERHGWVIDAAHKRGLFRFPHLIADSADAALDISPVERQAVLASKAVSVKSTTNSADRLRPTEVVESLDKYDSTIGQSY